MTAGGAGLVMTTHAMTESVEVANRKSNFVQAKQTTLLAALLLTPSCYLTI
jgi:hypothetical protein